MNNPFQPSGFNPNIETFSLFSEQSVKILRAMQKKYEDHYAFFMKLSTLYKGEGKTGQQARLSKTLVLIEAVNDQISEMLRKPTPSKDEFNLLLTKEKELNDNIQYFAKDIAELPKAMQKKIEQAEKETNMSLARLAQSSEIIKGRMSGLIKKTSSPLSNLAGQIGGTVLGSMLGPLGGLAQAGMDLYKQGKQRKIQEQNKTLTGALIKEGSSFEDFNKLYGGLGFSGRVPESQTSGFERNLNSQFEGGPTSVTGATNPFAGNTMGVNIGDSLFTFFNTDAYRAKWTFELLDTLKHIAGTSSNKTAQKGMDPVGEGVKGMLSKFGPAVLGAMPAILAGLVGAALGTAIGYVLNKIKIGNKTLSEHIWNMSPIGMGVNAFEKVRVMQGISEQRKGIRPDVKRALELQDKGMSIKDSVIQAKLEQEQAGEPLTKKPKISVELEGPFGRVGEESSGKSDTEKLLKEISGKLDNTGSKGMSSGNYNATNIGDPFIEALSTGSLDIN